MNLSFSLSLCCVCRDCIPFVPLASRMCRASLVSGQLPSVSVSSAWSFCSLLVFVRSSKWFARVIVVLSFLWFCSSLVFCSVRVSSITLRIRWSILILPGQWSHPSSSVWLLFPSLPSWREDTPRTIDTSTMDTFIRDKNTFQRLPMAINPSTIQWTHFFSLAFFLSLCVSISFSNSQINSISFILEETVTEGEGVHSTDGEGTSGQKSDSWESQWREVKEPALNTLCLPHSDENLPRTK